MRTVIIIKECCYCWWLPEQVQHTTKTKWTSLRSLHSNSNSNPEPVPSFLFPPNSNLISLHLHLAKYFPAFRYFCCALALSNSVQKGKNAEWLRLWLWCGLLNSKYVQSGPVRSLQLNSNSLLSSITTPYHFISLFSFFLGSGPHFTPDPNLWDRRRVYITLALFSFIR